MSTYTPLRHKVLSAIGKGRVSINADDRVKSAITLRTTQAQVTRAFNWVEDGFLIEKRPVSGRGLAVDLNAAGKGLLHTWDTRHGEVEW